MSYKDFFADLTDDAPVLRKVTYKGKSKDVYYRKITAGERLTINKNIRARSVGKEAVNTEISLEDLYLRNMMLLQCSAVEENGSRIFKKISEVQELEAGLFDALYKEAEEINKEDANEGKS